MFFYASPSVCECDEIWLGTKVFYESCLAFRKVVVGVFFEFPDKLEFQEFPHWGDYRDRPDIFDLRVAWGYFIQTKKSTCHDALVFVVISNFLN